MLVTSTGLRTGRETANEPVNEPVNEPTVQPSSAAPSAEAAPAEVLISTQQVLFGTAVVQRTRRGRIAAALRHVVTEANRARHPYLRHYAYIEDARMAREMERL